MAKRFLQGRSKSKLVDGRGAEEAQQLAALQVEHLTDLFGLHPRGELHNLVAQPMNLAQDLRGLDPMTFLLHGDTVPMASHQQR